VIRAVIFDLDDTLYCERDYVLSGFRAIAEQLESAYGNPAAEMLAMMEEVQDRDGRRAVLPAVLRSLPHSGFALSDLVRIYRQHVPAIQLYPGYRELLIELRAVYELGIITDGLPEVQHAKIKALALDDLIDQIICTWEYGAEKEKPHPFSFQLMLDRLGLKPSEAVFVGDNADKDCHGARNMGMKCVRVQNPVSSDDWETADFVVDSLLQLPILLSQVGEKYGEA
jgi:putative hydrolase of the HAD superfamily